VSFLINPHEFEIFLMFLLKMLNFIIILISNVKCLNSYHQFIFNNQFITLLVVFLYPIFITKANSSLFDFHLMQQYFIKKLFQSPDFYKP